MTSRILKGTAVLLFAMIAAGGLVAVAFGPHSHLGLNYHPAKGSVAKYRAVLHADYLGFTDLKQLVAVSSVVARVKVVRILSSYRIPLDPPVQGPVGKLPAPPPGSIAAWKAGQPSVSQPVGQQGSPGEQGPLKTDVLVRVVSVVKGSGIKNGSEITLTLPGGTDSLGKEVEEGNPLPTNGQEELVFLHRNARESTKYVTGGAQGRFQVQPGGTVRALAADTPVGKAHNHESLGTFMDAVRASVTAKP